MTNVIVSSKINDKQDDINFKKVKFPFLDGNVPLSPSYAVCFGLFVLREYLLILVTSATETNF